MKRALLLFSISFLLFACEKDSLETGYLIPIEELPDWLISSIEYDEGVIETSPKYYLAFGAWSRSKWNNEYYYQYINYLSSTIIPPISHLGDTLDIPPLTSTDFSKEKCCSEFVWKAPRFRDYRAGE
jgi:hypothetical protein